MKLSSYPGVTIDPTNSIDSTAGVQAAINAVTGTGNTLVIDGPVFTHINTGSNDYQNVIFVGSNVNISASASGMITSDATTTMSFCFVHSKNVTINNLHFRSIGQTGTTAIGGQNSPSSMGSSPGNFHNLTLQPYLTANYGNVFSGGGEPLWSGPSAYVAQFNVRGECQGITFNNCTFDVPPGTSVANFIFTLFQFAAEWVPNLPVTSSSPPVVSNYITTTNPTAALGATTFTLSSLWTLPTYQMRVTFSSGETRFVQFTNGQTTVGSFAALTLPQTSAQIVVDTAAIPMGLVFNNCYFDGVLMGLVNAAGTQMYNCRWGRYSDMQDGTTGTVTFSAALASGATTATLSTSVYPGGLWPYQSGQYAFTLSQGQMVYCNMTMGSAAVGTFGTQVYFTAQPYANATGCSISSAWQFGNGTYNITLSDGSTNTLVVSNSGNTLVLGTAYSGTSGAYMAAITGGNGMTGNGAIIHLWLTGTSTAVTQVAFAGATGSYTMYFSTGVTRTVTLTKAASASQGNLAITFTSLGGSSTAQIASNGTINLGIINGATATATSGNIGGVQHFSAPPHALYMNTSTSSVQGAYPYQLIMKGCTDESTFVGLPTRRATSSGYTNSIKFAPDTKGVGGRIIAQTTVDGFTSSRAEGGALLLPQGYGAAVNGINTTVAGGRLINSTFSYDSSIATLDGGVTVPALSFSNGLPTCNVTIDNNVFIDRAAVPAANPPFIGSSVATSNNVVISNNTQYMNNWNNGQFPYIQFTGNNIQCVGNRMHFNTHSDTQTIRGVFFTQSPAINTQSKFEAVVAGWRLIPLTFASAIPANWNGSGVNLAVAWPYATATLLVTFLDNETRWISFVQSSNVINGGNPFSSYFNQTALTNSSSMMATGHTAQGMCIGYNRVNYQMRCGFSPGTNGTRATLEDLTNNIVYTFDNNMITAVQTLYQTVTPPMGGTTMTLAPTIGSGDTVVEATLYMNSGAAVVTGMTGTLGLGYTGSPSIFISGMTGTGTAAQSAQMSASSPMLVSSYQSMVLSAANGTFTGNGSVVASVRSTYSFTGT